MDDDIIKENKQMLVDMIATFFAYLFFGIMIFFAIFIFAFTSIIMRLKNK